MTLKGAEMRGDHTWESKSELPFGHVPPEMPSGRGSGGGSGQLDLPVWGSVERPGLERGLGVIGVEEIYHRDSDDITEAGGKPGG